VTDRRYNKLAQDLTRRANREAARAKVSGVEKAMNRLHKEDDKLGRRRPEVVASLRASIEASLGEIFANHMTAAYVAIVREVRFLNDETALLRAVAGMVPRGQSKINPATNSIQSLVAVRRNGSWKVALFHNTPAAFHGRPQASQELTAELQKSIME
jgi:hypothetical protein